MCRRVASLCSSLVAELIYCTCSKQVKAFQNLKTLHNQSRRLAPFYPVDVPDLLSGLVHAYFGLLQEFCFIAFNQEQLNVLWYSNCLMYDVLSVCGLPSRNNMLRIKTIETASGYVLTLMNLTSSVRVQAMKLRPSLQDKYVGLTTTWVSFLTICSQLWACRFMRLRATCIAHTRFTSGFLNKLKSFFLLNLHCYNFVKKCTCAIS